MVPGLQVESGLETDPEVVPEPGGWVEVEPGALVEVEPPGGVCVASHWQMELAAEMTPATLSKPQALTTHPAAEP